MEEEKASPERKARSLNRRSPPERRRAGTTKVEEPREPKTTLTRTASVKETWRERLDYHSLSTPYTSAMRFRRGAYPLAKTLSGDNIGFTRSQYFTHHDPPATASSSSTSRDTSRDRAMLAAVDEDIAARRRLNRSLRVQSLSSAQDWRRRTIHATSAPYLPVRNYHRRRDGPGDFPRPTHYPGAYRKESLERREREERQKTQVDAEMQGRIALAKYYTEPKRMRSKSGERKRLV